MGGAAFAAIIQLISTETARKNTLPFMQLLMCIPLCIGSSIILSHIDKVPLRASRRKHVIRLLGGFPLVLTPLAMGFVFYSFNPILGIGFLIGCAWFLLSLANALGNE